MAQKTSTLTDHIVDEIMTDHAEYMSLCLSGGNGEDKMIWLRELIRSRISEDIPEETVAWDDAWEEAEAEVARELLGLATARYK